MPIYEIGEFSVNQKDSSCAVLKSKWDTIIYLTIPFYDGTNNKDDYRIGFYQISLNDLSYPVSIEMQLPSKKNLFMNVHLIKHGILGMRLMAMNANLYQVTHENVKILQQNEWKTLVEFNNTFSTKNAVPYIQSNK